MTIIFFAKIKNEEDYDFHFPKVFLITFSEGNGRAEVEEKNSNDMMMLTKLFCVLAVTFSVQGGSS